METKSSEKRFALIIDADNVSSRYIKYITDELSKYGTITYKRIYGDWTSTLHAKWKDALLENSITPIQQFSYTVGKNATDSAMIIDAMDIMYTNSVEGFCIVSSDSDFTRLASRIRESGLMVIGMGEKKTPQPFRKACDIFTTLELLVGEGSGRGRRGHRSQAGAGEGPSIEQVESAVVDIVTDNQNNGKATGLGEVGSRLLKRYPDFDVRSYGTNQLTKLLGEFSSVQVIKSGNSVMVELSDVATPAAATAVADVSAEAAPAPAAEPAEGEPASDGAAEGGSRKTSRRGRRGRRRGQGQKAQQEQAAALEQAAGEPEADSDKAAAAVPEPVADVEQAPSEVSAAEEPAADAAEAPIPSEKETSVSQEASPEEAPAAHEASSEDASEEPNAKKAAETKPAKAAKSAKSAKSAKPAKKRGRRTGAKKEEKAADAAPRRRGRPRKSPMPESPDETPDRYIVNAIKRAGGAGASVADLGRQVRSAYKDFKVRDLGFTQFRKYVESLSEVKVEKQGSDFVATLED